MFSNMLLARHVGNLGLIETIKAIFAGLLGFLGNLINFICTPIYYAFMGIATIISYAEVAFKELAGIDALSVNGTEYGGASSEGYDLVIAFITDETVQDVFWSIMALSLVLLFIFTIVAIIKSEFTLDLKGSAKGPIIARAFKSLVNFLVIPVVTIISVIATNFLTKTVYDLFEAEGTTIVNECFYVGAYNANRARNDEKFATYLTSGGYWYSSGASPFSGGSGQDAVANKIDELFHDFEESNLVFTEYDYKDRWAIENKPDAIDSNYADWFMQGMSYPNENSSFSLWNINMVRYFYDISAFDYILALGSAIVIAWIMLTVSLVLVKRAFELVILYLLAPPMIAIAPLDGGQAEKRWRGEFMKRLLSVIAPIFAFNMYFILIPLFKNIQLLPPADTTTFISSSIASNGVMLGTYRTAVSGFLNIFNVFFQLVCVITGLSVLKSASSLLSSLLGVEDLVKSGGEAAKKAVATGTKVFSGAAAISGTAIKGVAAGARAVTGFASAAKNKVLTAKDRLQSLEEYNDAKTQKVAAEDEIEGYNDQISKKEFALATMNDRRAELIEQGQDTKSIDNAIAKNQKETEELKSKRDESQKRADDASEIMQTRKKGISSSVEDNLENLRSRYTKDENGKVKWKSKAQYEKDLKEASKIENRFNNKSFTSAITDAYTQEFGAHANETSVAGRLAKEINRKAQSLENVPFLNKIPNLTGTLEQMYAVSGPDQKRRLNDALVGLFGDSGGGDLYKMWFNPNPRGNLFMGVPEQKKRDAKVSANIDYAARKKYDAELEEKKVEEKEREFLRRYMAKEIGKDDEYESLLKTLSAAKKSGDESSIRVAKLNVERFEANNNLAQREETAYKKGVMGTSAFQKFREDRKNEAMREETAEEIKTAQKTQSIVNEEKKRQNVQDSPQNVKVVNDQPQDMKIDSESITKLMDEMVRKLKTVNQSGGIDQEAINAITEPIKKGNEDVKSAIISLTKALEKLGK